MKKKHYLLLPAFTALSAGTLTAQTTTEVPAAAKVDQAAADFKAGEFTQRIANVRDILQKEAGDNPDMSGVFDALGLNNIDSYAQSSTKDGNDFITRVYLHNGEKSVPVTDILGESAPFNITEMAPSGADLALQLNTNLAQVESLIRNVMVKGKANDGEIAEFEASMKEFTPFGMSTSDLLKKINVKTNIVIDFDKTTKLSIPNAPMAPIDRPNMVFRFDGATWMWEKLGDAMMAQAGIPFERTENEGTITYAMPEAMKASFMGYLPKLVVDTKADQIWLTTSPEFLEKCLNGPKLKDDPAFQAAIKGLPQEGNMISYASKDFQAIASELFTTLDQQGLLNQMPPADKANLFSSLEKWGKMDQGTVSIITKDTNGLLLSGRSYETIEETFEQLEKSINDAMEQL